MRGAAETYSDDRSASLPRDQLVLGVRDVARLLGRTPTAIYRAIDRGADWLPRPFRMGGRLGWLRKDVENHVRMMARTETI